MSLPFKMCSRERCVTILFSYFYFVLLRFFWFFFSVRLVSVPRGHSVFSSPPQRPMTSDFEGFHYQILSITLFSYVNSWERASIFPFQCWVLKKGTTGTILITSLVLLRWFNAILRCLVVLYLWFCKLCLSYLSCSIYTFDTFYNL